LLSLCFAAVMRSNGPGRLARRARNALWRRMAVGDNVILHDNVHVGPGSVLWAPRRLDIGNNVYIGKFVTIEVDGAVGDGTLIANNVGVVGRTDHDITQVGVAISRARWVGDFPEELSRPTEIGADVWIGFGAIVLSGVSIGASAIIGSGAVVTGDVPANCIMVGSPARMIAKRFANADDLQDHWRRLHESGIRGLPWAGDSMNTKAEDS
jgi:serine acetyltransferase